MSLDYWGLRKTSESVSEFTLPEAPLVITRVFRSWSPQRASRDTVSRLPTTCTTTRSLGDTSAEDRSLDSLHAARESLDCLLEGESLERTGLEPLRLRATATCCLLWSLSLGFQGKCAVDAAMSRSELL
jgi:hypothetical protein